MKVTLLGDSLRINGLNGAFVERDVSPDARRTGGIDLIAARGGAVSFQIILESDSGSIASLSLQPSPLTYAQGGEIPASEYEFYTQWFHRLDDMLVPDLLIPIKEGYPAFRVPQDMDYLRDQRVGAIWVDLWIAEDAAQGDYRGTVTLTVDGQTHDVSIHVTVTCAVLPEKPLITADLNNYADSLSTAFASLKENPERYRDGSYLAVERSFYRMAREHRCLYHNLPYRHSGVIPESFIPELEGEGKYIRVKSWEAFDRHFGPYFDGSAFEGCHGGAYPVEFAYLPFHLGWPADYAKWGRKGYRTEYRRILWEFVRHFEEMGWDKTVFEILLNHKKDYRFFPYTVDEIWYEHDQDVVDDYYGIIRDIYDTSHAQFVFRMDSSNHFGNHFDHRFADYCRMWVAGWAMFNWFPESVKAMRDRGNILWIYGSVLQSLEEPLSSIYVWPMQALMTGTTGFTVWNTTGFGTDPLACPAARGGEAMFYPGSHFGVEEALPSIRLKVLRNAMQTADLVAAQAATPQEKPLRALINQAFGFSGDGDWFCPKPDFIDTPPRYWDFDGEVNEKALPPLYLGKDCDFGAALSERILMALDDRAGTEGDGVRFKFQ